MKCDAGLRQAISSRQTLESLRLSLRRATKVDPLVALRYEQVGLAGSKFVAEDGQRRQHGGLRPQDVPAQ